MARFKGLIFDLDGTLSDSVAMILKSSSSTHERLGLPWDEATCKEYIGRPMYETAARFAPGQEEEYRRIFGEYNMLYIPKMIKPFPGVLALLAGLQEQDVAMSILTSRLQWGADWSVEILGIEKYFVKVWGVEASEKHKPDPEPALLALANMGVEPGEAAFIGDAPVDVKCGKAAGMTAIGVGWGVGGEEALREAGADYYVRNTNELYKILLG